MNFTNPEAVHTSPAVALWTESGKLVISPMRISVYCTHDIVKLPRELSVTIMEEPPFLCRVGLYLDEQFCLFIGEV